MHHGRVSVRARFYEVGWDILDIIIPPRCAGCDCWGDRWCEACRKSTQTIGNNICLQCGIPFADSQNLRCDHCQYNVKYFSRLRSWAYYEGSMQRAIQALKYHRNFGLAITLGFILADYLRELAWKFDVIIPVPLSRERLRDRGYNQALLLAKPVAWATSIPLRSRGLMRIRETKSQVGLTRSQRVANVSAAFAAQSAIVSGNSVLIIDDVVTTGATMNACAKALKDADADQVYGLTLARSFQTHGKL